MLALGGGLAVAQDATPAAAAHPFVGSWWVDTEPENPANPLHLAIVASDGTYMEVDPDGTAVGVWEATGDTTADLTFHFLLGPGGGNATVRGSVEVAPDGHSWTASYTIEFINPDGTTTGEVGPGMAEATRITVDPQGTPVGSFAEVFGLQPGGTPDATPAS